MNSRIAVLDIGTAKVACLVADFSLEGPPVLVAVQQGHSRGVRKGVIVDPDATVRAVDAVLREAQREAGGPIDALVVALGGPHVSTVESRGFIPIFPKGREITREDVFQALNHSRQTPHSAETSVVMALPKRWQVDGEQGVASPLGLTGSRLEVSTLLVSAAASQLESLEAVMSALERKVSQLVWRPLAAGLGVLSPEAMQQGVAVVDMGAGGTDVAVFQLGQMVHGETLPVGSWHVTSDLSQLLKCTLEEAEELKRRHASLPAEQIAEGDSVQVMQTGMTERRPMARRVFCEIVESRVNEIGRLVHQSLDSAGLLDAIPGGILLTGGGSRIPGIVEIFSRHVPGHKVRVASPVAATALDRLAGEPELAVVVGLAKFAGQTLRDPVSPAGTNGKWTDKLRAFFTSLTGGER